MEHGKKSRRNTQQRQVVLEELRKLTSHPTAVELHDIARRRLPKLSLGTVYRNLNTLARMGLVRRLETSGAEARFDAELSDHYHVRCVQCGRIDDAPEVVVAPPRPEPEDSGGYEIVGYHLELLGVCPRCRAELEAGTGSTGPDGLQV